MTNSFHVRNIAVCAATIVLAVGTIVPALANAKAPATGLTPDQLKTLCAIVGLESSAWLADHTEPPAFNANRDEVRAFCTHLGFHSRAAAEFRTVDLNRDGKLDTNEFAGLSKAVRNGADDLDGDGYFTLAELTPWTSKATRIAAAPPAPARAEPDGAAKVVETASRTPLM